MSTQTQVVTTRPQATKPKALDVMASRLNVDPAKLLVTLKSTVFSKASDDEIIALVLTANEYGLNPFLKEMYAFPAKGGGIVPIVSVDGWNKMLLRQPSFDGIEFEFQEGEDAKPITCTATVYIKDRSKPVKITEYFQECYRNTETWNNMPHRMLRNRTLCQAARLAFGFAGVYNPDEAIDVTSTVMPEKPLKPIRSEIAAGEPVSIVAPDVAPRTPQEELEKVIIDAGFSFDHWKKWAEQSPMKPIDDPGSLAGFGDIKKNDASRLLRAVNGMLDGIRKENGL